jgi:hypothetical protein
MFTHLGTSLSPAAPKHAVVVQEAVTEYHSVSFFLFFTGLCTHTVWIVMHERLVIVCTSFSYGHSSRKYSRI